MRYYVAITAPTKMKMEIVEEEGVDSILLSYAYVKRGLPDSVTKAVKDGKLNVMLDSGAFTNMFKPGTVTVEGYQEFLQSHAGLVTEYITLDDPKKREITVKNYERLLKAGLDPIVVDHVWFEVDEPFKRYYAKGVKVCWGGMVSGPNAPMGDWAAQLIGKARTKASHGAMFHSAETWRAVLSRITGRHGFAVKKPVSKIHLLAVGNRLRRLLPYLGVVDSIDSSTAFVAPGYGRLLVAREGVDGKAPRIAAFKYQELPKRSEMEEYLRENHPDLKNLSTTYIDRTKLAVRETNRYYKMIEDWYEANKELGHDQLLELAVHKSETEFEDLFQARELLLQIPAHWDVLHKSLGLPEQPAEGDLSEAVGDFVDGLMEGQLKDPSQEEEVEVKLLSVRKDDEEKRIVFGVVLEPEETDAQADVVGHDQIERAAHLWLARLQNRGIQHKKLANTKLEIYESYVAPADFEVGGQKVKKGTWLLMYHVTDDELWKAIKDGEYTGFSMGGFARRRKLPETA